MQKTPHVIAVLASLNALDAPFGYQIAKHTGIPAPTVYRVLSNLYNEGWVVARADGRRRRYYLTTFGESWAKAWATPNSAVPARYRRRSTLVQAVQWTGANLEIVLKFGKDQVTYADGKLQVTTDRGPDVVPVDDWLVERSPDLIRRVTAARFAEVYEPVQ